MFAGLLLFGVLIGLTTGLSLTSGASTSLMSGLFAFVGGVVITYAGFTKPQKDGVGTPTPDLKQVGGALSALSLGVICGVFFGMWFRYKDPLSWRPKTAVSPGPSAPTIESILGLNDGSIGGEPTTQRVATRLVSHWYDTDPQLLRDATLDLADLAKVCVQKCRTPTE